MSNPFIRKLQLAAELSEEDVQFLEKAANHTRELGPREDITIEGDRPENVHVLIEGWASRNKTLENGQRQIMAFLLPGDFCDLHIAILDAMDHTITTLGPAKVAYISRSVIEEIARTRPSISLAFWWCTLVDEATLREWLVNMGQRPADQQMGHLFYEILLRLESIGLIENRTFDFPLTQAELAQALGLSHVHVNRTAQELRDRGLIRWSGRTLTVLDREGLRDFTGFDASYLHLTQRQNGAS